jgi:hypothetical protein
MTFVLYQSKQAAPPYDRLAPLRQLLRSVQILRLRRPGDPEISRLETDVRARLTAARGLPAKPAVLAPIQGELFPEMPTIPERRKRRR